MMGLGHTCWTGTGDQPRDDQGDLVPTCFPTSALPPEIRAATMYNFQACGETEKSSPEADDIAAVCAAYPSADDPGFCSEVDIHGGDGCCTVAPGNGHGSGRRSAAGGLLLLLGLTWMRRRRR
jgi:MYXO-CTERM domain-containing protein